jgi:hypothetical protein
MTKKEYILKILDATMEYFPLARGLKILIASEALDDTVIDTLINVLNQTIDGVNDIVTKNKLQKSKEFLEKLKSIELESHQQDKE